MSEHGSQNAGGLVCVQYRRPLSAPDREERSLASELGNAGFVNVRRAEMGDSGVESYSAVEVEHRWKDALGMHCSKPVSGEGLNEPHPTRGSDHV